MGTRKTPALRILLYWYYYKNPRSAWYYLKTQCRLYGLGALVGRRKLNWDAIPKRGKR